MWVVIIVAILLTAALISCYSSEDIIDTLPMTVCGVILLLYLLAFGRLLYAIDFISFAVLAGSAILIMRKKRLLLPALGRILLQPYLIISILLLVGITFFVREQIFTWWDDINFWSTDAKALYYLNGFPGKYGNVSPEFGDYPPVTSLFKWLFLHFSPKHYVQGLQFAGYYCLNIVLLMPLLRMLRKRNIPVQAAGSILLLFLPGIVNGVLFYGTCADVTMGIAYGALLWSIWDRNGHTANFYMARIALFASVLSLTKSVGILWTLSAFLFLLLVPGERRKRCLVLPAFIVLLTEGSWVTFCLVNRRIAKLTSAGIHMAAGGYHIPDNTVEKIGFFLKGFLFIPMHSDQNITFDLSSFAMLLILVLLPLLFNRTGICTAREGKKLSVFMLIMAFVIYGAIFVAHISIFQTEAQYLDAAAMALSLSRYGVPYTMGGLYLLTGIALSAAEQAGQEVLPKKMRLIYICCAVFILLTADYRGMYSGLAGYRKLLGENRQHFAQMIDADGQKFLAKTKDNSVLWGKRVLYLRDSTKIHWVKDTYISNEAAPIALVYSDYNTSGMTAEQTGSLIMASHASYLYVDAVSGDTGSNLGVYTEDGTFSCGEIYRIIQTNGSVRLEKQ